MGELGAFVPPTSISNAVCPRAFRSCVSAPPSSTSTFITTALPFRAAVMRGVSFDHSFTFRSIVFLFPSFTASRAARYVAFHLSVWPRCGLSNQCLDARKI